MIKKDKIKIGVLIVVICIMCFSDCSFAAEGDGLDVLGYSLNFVVSVLGRIRVFFAKLAGAFLTNKWVYGEVLGLDALIWQYWNVMKNLANFGLGFYFVYVIFRGLIKQGKEGITQRLKTIILWLLIAGVGIQASWFFVATVIDVSTITLAAAGAFPSQVISGSPYVEGALKKSLSDYLAPGAGATFVEKGKKISLFPKNQETLLGTETVKLKEQKDFTEFVDSLMPSANDVSGPLYYMGFSILNTNVITSINTSSDKGIKATILNTIIQGLTTIIFSIEMFILCVLALMRIIYLWMFIIMSPLAVLLRCIEKSGQKLGDSSESFLSKFTKQINFKSFFINVFKPTIIVLGFGIAILFVSLVKSVLIDNPEGKPFDIKGTVITSNKGALPSNGNQGDQTYTTTIDNNLMEVTLANTGKTFLEMILSVLTVLIVYFIIKFAVKFGDGKDFVSKNIGGIQDEVQNLMLSMPVMPVAGYDDKGKPTTRFVNAGQVFGLGGRNSIIGAKIGQYQKRVEEVSDKQKEIINSWIEDGKGAGFLSANEKSKIETAMGNGIAITNGTIGLQRLTNVKNELASIRSNDGKGMTLSLQTASNNGFWLNQFGQRLTAMKGQTISGTNNQVWNDMIDAWNSSQTTDIEKKLEEIFKNHTDRIKAYADFFELQLDSNDWEYLKNADISRK